MHTVIVGAGFGGLAAANAITDNGGRVTLIDQRNHHTFQPLLYQVATAGLTASDVCYSTRSIARRNARLTSLQATGTGFDRETRTVTCADGTHVGYDALVLAMGAVTADFGVPGVTAHAFGLKSAAEADAVRRHVLTCFEDAARAATKGTTPDDALTTIVVVGGGPTGVEMAGGYAELTDRVLHRDYPELDPAATRVVLVEGRDALLNGFAPKLARNARRTLERMGVEVQLGEQVAKITDRTVELASGIHIDTATVVWAAGVRAHPMAERLGLATGRAGRVLVDDHLRVAGYDEVYAIGDLAAAPNPQHPGQLLPQVAPVAVQAGEHVAAHIAGRATEPFRYRDKGSMATIGRNAAVVERPNGFTMTGFVGWIAWLGLHLIMLMGFRNRATVFVNWAWNYLTYDRASRVLIDPVNPVTPALGVPNHQPDLRQSP